MRSVQIEGKKLEAFADPQNHRGFQLFIRLKIKAL